MRPKTAETALALRGAVWVTILVCALSASALSGGCGNAGDEVGTAAPPRIAVGLNTEVRVGDERWKATAVQVLDHPETTDQSDGVSPRGRRVVRIALTITNHGRRPMIVDDSVLTLIDSRFRKLDHYTGPPLLHWGGQDLLLKQIRPGETRTGHVDFEVPADASGLYVRVADPAHAEFWGDIELGM